MREYDDEPPVPRHGRRRGVRGGPPREPVDSHPYRRFKEDHCDRCGFEPEHPCQLHVHHKDRDRENNVPDNLVTLCANCHTLEHNAPRRFRMYPEPAMAA